MDEQLISDVREAFDSAVFDPADAANLWADGSGSGDAVPGAPAAAVALPVGDRLDDFEILDEVGRGGMGIVYRARQASLNRAVALKVLPPALGRGDSALRRFRTEAQAVARLRHPNVVPIYAQGEYEGHLYYAMELIEGVSLDVAIHSRPEMLSSAFWCNRSTTSSPGQEEATPQAGDAETRAKEDDRGHGARPTLLPRTLEDFRHIARLVAGVADGLAHAYEQGVIHRDIKPHNLLLGFDGRLHITDFGLAHLTDEPHLTMSGQVMGTAAYLSPEQVRGGVLEVDHHTDIYSLGATLYELITGRRPFEGHTRDQVLNNICTLEPPRPRRLDKRIPRDLETVCLKAMEKAPARRYSSSSAMAEDLRRFADDLPILSRRVGPFETAFKWAGRHRAVAAAMAATAASLILGVWIIQSARTSRRTEAANLLQSAYDRLAYVDYRETDLVIDTIERARVLGADPLELSLAQALVDLGRSDNSSAIKRLQAILNDVPDDTRSLYMLAWAQWRSGDRTASLVTFQRAAAHGEPWAADAWFFRGLAAHFDRPSLAVESYRQAIALRAREHEFHPQAVLHLARAYNQQMYATRSADAFVEAEASLRQLIEYGHYGAYPYYLLSIAHRLAAESHDADPTGRSAGLAAYHYREALQWARAGQLADPEDDRPVTADAECLESLGRFEEAIEARTRAIGLADRPRAEWEGRHYRWRLYYWTDQFAAALEDLTACETFSPHSRFYTFVYPALVYAELGEIEQASKLARGIGATGPADALSVLWSATTLRLIGRAGEANALLGTNVDSIDYAGGLVPLQSDEWVRSLYAYCLGETDFNELVTLADGAASSRKLLSEAHFHAGAMALAAGQRGEALGHFTSAYRGFDGEMAYTFHAKTIRERMRHDPEWPLWLPPPVDDQGRDDGRAAPP